MSSSYATTELSPEAKLGAENSAEAPKGLGVSPAPDYSQN